jgi:hypothetical protein
MCGKKFLNRKSLSFKEKSCVKIIKLGGPQKNIMQFLVLNTLNLEFKDALAELIIDRILSSFYQQ